MEQLKKDVREVIEKRIPLCEIIDPPYSQSSMRERLRKAIRTVIWEYTKEKRMNHFPSTTDVLHIETRRKDGATHWYIRFDVERWDEEWARIKAMDNA